MCQDRIRGNVSTDAEYKAFDHTIDKMNYTQTTNRGNDQLFDFSPQLDTAIYLNANLQIKQQIYEHQIDNNLKMARSRIPDTGQTGLDKRTGHTCNRWTPRPSNINL